MPGKFEYRSTRSELLDAIYIPKESLYQNLRELEFINRILGGYDVTLQGIKELVIEKTRSYHIVDLGCGGGGTMMHIAVWARKKGYKVKLTGVDKNADVIDFMIDNCKEFSEIDGIVSDYHDFLKTESSVDIIHCSLFCHHLKDEELILFFRSLKSHSKTGFVVNDLHRNWIPYYGVKLITYALNGSELSKNDGPVSVLRSFKSKEIKMLLQKARVSDYSLNWKWAFRYLIIGHNHPKQSDRNGH